MLKTLKKQNGEDIQKCNLTTASPTYSHMALAALVQSGMVKYILSQNCDGLHLRSGISQSNLSGWFCFNNDHIINIFASEIHGNMYLESCEDEHIHYRCFDVTEKTNIKRHKTGRNCSKCQKPLSDTIVHFGEMNRFNNPYRWESGIDLDITFHIL